MITAQQIRDELTESIKGLTLEHGEDVHRYTYNGKACMGASMVAKEGKVPPKMAHIEEAADHGNQYHQEAHEMNLDYGRSNFPREGMGYAGFLGWSNANGLELVASEQMVLYTAEMAYYSAKGTHNKKGITQLKTVHVAGTCDSIWLLTKDIVITWGNEPIVLHAGTLIIFDIKTGNLLKSANAQVGIYQLAVPYDSVACIFDVPKIAEPFHVDQLVFDLRAREAGRIMLESWVLKRGALCNKPTGTLAEENPDPYVQRSFFTEEEPKEPGGSEWE